MNYEGVSILKSGERYFRERLLPFGFEGTSSLSLERERQDSHSKIKIYPLARSCKILLIISYKGVSINKSGEKDVLHTGIKNSIAQALPEPCMHEPLSVANALLLSLVCFVLHAGSCMGDGCNAVL